MFRCCPRLTTVTVCLTKLRVRIASPKYIKYGMITRHSMKFQEGPTHLSPGLGATDPNHFDTSQERLFKSLLACSEDQKHTGNHGQLEVGSSVRWWVIGCYWYTVGSIQIIPDWSCIWMYLVYIWGRLQSPCRSYFSRITWDHHQPGPFKDATYPYHPIPTWIRPVRNPKLLTLRHLHLPLLLGPLGHLGAPPCLTLHHGLWWRHESQQLTSADVKDLRLVALGIVYLRAFE